MCNIKNVKIPKKTLQEKRKDRDEHEDDPDGMTEKPAPMMNTLRDGLGTPRKVKRFSENLQRFKAAEKTVLSNHPNPNPIQQCSGSHDAFKKIPIVNKRICNVTTSSMTSPSDSSSSLDRVRKGKTLKDYWHKLDTPSLRESTNKHSNPTPAKPTVPAPKAKRAPASNRTKPLSLSLIPKVI